MKLAAMRALIETAGFIQTARSDKGLGEFMGREVFHFQKNISGVSPQTIQLGVLPGDQEDVIPLMSKNVPQILRDQVYELMSATALENSARALSGK